MRFDDETVLVTGASRGIGAAVADAFADAGAFVVGTATSDEGAVAIRERFASEGRRGESAVVDVSDASSVAALFAHLGEIDAMPGVVVNNAGITRDALLVRMNEEDWRAVIETDLDSVYRVSRAASRHLMKLRRGRIINVASVVAAMGNAGQANYAAAKAGVLGFTRALAHELGGRGITVNAIAPGFIDTDMTRALPERQREALLERIPLARLGTAREIAQVALFLASPGAAYVTGEVVHVNGGLYMG